MLEPQNLPTDNLNRDAIAKYKLENSKPSTFRQQILLLVVATEKLIQEEKESKSTVNLDLRREREQELAKLNAALAHSNEPGFGYEDESLYIVCHMVARSARKGWFSVYNRFVDRLNEILNNLSEPQIHLRSNALRQVLKKQHQLDIAEIYLDIAKGKYLEAHQNRDARRQLDDALGHTDFEDAKERILERFTSELELAAIRSSVNEQYEEQIKELGESLQKALTSLEEMQSIQQKCADTLNHLSMVIRFLGRVTEENPALIKRLVKEDPKLQFLEFLFNVQPIDNRKTSAGKLIAQRGLGVSATSRKSRPVQNPPSADDKESQKQHLSSPM